MNEPGDDQLRGAAESSDGDRIDRRQGAATDFLGQTFCQRHIEGGVGNAADQGQHAEAAQQRPRAARFHDPQEHRVRQQQCDKLRPHHYRPSPDAVCQQATAKRTDNAQTVADNRGGEGEIGPDLQRILGISGHVLGNVSDDGATRQHQQTEDDNSRMGAYDT